MPEEGLGTAADVLGRSRRFQQRTHQSPRVRVIRNAPAGSAKVSRFAVDA